MIEPLYKRLYRMTEQGRAFANYQTGRDKAFGDQAQKPYRAAATLVGSMSKLPTYQDLLAKYGDDQGIAEAFIGYRTTEQEERLMKTYAMLDLLFVLRNIYNPDPRQMLGSDTRL